MKEIFESQLKIEKKFSEAKNKEKFSKISDKDFWI